MNPDPFEERLRALRPAALPDELRERLAEPPPPAAAAARRPSPRILVLSFITAAAACLTYFLYPTHPVPVAPVVSPPESVANSSSNTRVLEVRPLSTITDETDRTWRFIEVTWVDEDTLVSTPAATVVQAHEPHRTVIPVPVRFD